MKKLENKVALVTGAASGMGKSIALIYAREGAKVVVTDLKEEDINKVVDEIRSGGGEAMGIVANVMKEEDVVNMIDKTVEAYGTLDILVNNAGIMDAFEPIEDVKDEHFERILAVNTWGPMRAMRKAVPIFKEKKYGIIVNIASAGGLYGSRAGVMYTASKHAVIGMTKNVGFQYANHGIRCNAIAPGQVATNIGKSMYGSHEFGMERAMAGGNLSPRVGQADEIATVALFLASDDSSFVNGSVIAVDGGWTAY